MSLEQAIVRTTEEGEGLYTLRRILLGEERAKKLEIITEIPGKEEKTLRGNCSVTANNRGRKNH